jgi:glc operon protein GlcG
MKKTEIAAQLIKKLEHLVLQYMNDPEDGARANGSAAVCIIDDDGNVYGKIFGSDKITGRERFKNAWLKASQAWITGMKTGEFEKLAFTGQINEKQFGIRRPDYIGWEGGQPVKLKTGIQLSVGFSGFRGSSDLEIVNKAAEMMEL